MIHDFATAPRPPKVSARPAPASVRPALKVNRRLAMFVILFIGGCSALWRVINVPADMDDVFVPGDDAKIEYMQAASTEEVLLKGPEPVIHDSVADDALFVQKRKELDTVLKNSEELEGEYGFYDSLQGSQWDVPVQRGVYLTAEDRERASYRYILQAASVRDRSEAVALVAKLKAIGLAASYSASSGNDNAYSGDAWYRVNVGPFSNVSVMNKAEDILVSMRMMPLKRRIQ